MISEKVHRYRFGVNGKPLKGFFQPGRRGKAKRIFPSKKIAWDLQSYIDAYFRLNIETIKFMGVEYV